MPRQKDLKRLVRARMQKTGEAYTAARAQITKQSSVEGPPAPTVDLAALAGMSDEKIKAATGCTWETWAFALDRHRADKLAHREIAKLVHEKYHTGPWWTQTVAVGYERIKGLRAIGQRRNGTYEASKSRTFAVPVDVLFDAWKDGRKRARWLKEKVRVRTATAHKSIRLDWPDGGIIAVGFLEKGDGKSSVAVSHAGLADRATADRVKQEWSLRLDALGDALNSR
jgi:hypothetical protein